jgi:pimeloyl-ACP methyl ester carboxylesterase
VPIDEIFLAHVRRECATVPARVWYSIHYEQLAYDPAPLLQDISAPTLVLRGEEDTIATAEHQSHLVSRIVGSQVISLPGRGHALGRSCDTGTIAGAFLQRS